MNKEPILIEKSVASFKITCSTEKFIMQLLACLRENFTLLDDPDYNRLYNETLDFLFRYAVEFLGFDKNTRVSSRILFELLADGYNVRSNEKISTDMLSDFLNERRIAWKNV